MNQDLLFVLILVAALTGLIVYLRKRPQERKKRGNPALVSFWSGLVLIVVGNVAIYTDWAGDNWIYCVVLGGVLFILGFAGLVANMAKAKGRSWIAFFWLSVFFTPILMWIIAATITPIPGSKDYVPFAATVVTEPDSLEQIKKLGKLREQGLITDEEFEIKKRDLLNRL